MYNVYIGLNPIVSVLVSDDLEECVAKALEEYKGGNCVWVMDDKFDVYAYVSSTGLERF